MSFRNFFSARILWDESMASGAAAWCDDHPDGLLVGLVGGDHVKFGCGVAGRCARALGSIDTVSTVMLNPQSSDTAADPTDGRASPSVRRDRRGSDGRVNFGEYTLQLRFSPVPGDGGAPIIGARPEDRKQATKVAQVRDGGAVLPLADFLVFS